MKITTLLLVLCIFNSFGQNPTTASEYITAGLANSIATSNNSQIQPARSEQESITLFTDFNTFLSSCGGDDSLIFEDFAGGPVNPSAGVEGCESIISSAGGECFPAGEIQQNIQFTNRFGNGVGTMIFFDGTTFGIDNPAVGANSFDAFTVINFTGDLPVTSVGFNLHSPLGDGPIDLRVFGESGLLETVTFQATSAALFVGFIAEEPLDRIELENLPGTLVELVSQFYFGTCEVLSIEDSIFSDVSFYPNPAQGVLRINSQATIETITLFNLLGQRVATHSLNSQNPTINIQNLKSGVYIIEVSAQNKKSSYKLIKE